MREPLRFCQITLAPPQRLTRQLRSSDICDRTHKFQFPGGMLEGLSYNMQVLHRAVRHQQTMFHIKIGLFIGRAVESLLHTIPIVGMNSLKWQRQCWLNGSVQFKDSVALVRPVDFSTRNVPAEAACAANALPLSQESFAALQVLLCFFALINVRQGSVPFDDVSMRIVQRHSPNQKPEIFSIRAPTPRLIFERLTACQGSLPRFHVLIKIVWMNRGLPT